MIDSSRFSFELSWAESLRTPGRATAAEWTLGQLTARVGDTTWLPSGFEWSWIELLEWMTDSWRWLLGEDGLPVSTQAGTAQQLRHGFAAWLDGLPDGEREVGDADLWDFMATHDLGKALRGAWPDSLVVWREGRLGHVVTESESVEAAWADVQTALVGLGDQIATRLSHLDGEPRADKARQSWRARSNISGQTWLEVAGLPTSMAVEFADSVEALSAHPEELADDEILMAARMSAPLGDQAAKSVLSVIWELPRGSSHRVDVLAERFAKASVPDDLKPHEEGYERANAFRGALGLGDREPFAPLEWLEANGVDYREAVFASRSVDAVAVWGARHGPAVVVNLEGAHGRSRAGRNASVAHEIAHLMLDRGAALPAGEVLGGLRSLRVERRANAFAAELLLPRRVAGDRFVEVTQVDVAKRALSRLTSAYGVSGELAAWQVRNSRVPLDDAVRDFLRSKVGPGRRF